MRETEMGGGVGLLRLVEWRCLSGWAELALRVLGLCVAKTRRYTWEEQNSPDTGQGKKEHMMNTRIIRGLRRTITSAAALAALAFGAQVSANEVTAPVEVDPFVVVAMDAASSEVVGDVEVTDITSVTVVDGAEEVVTTVEYSPVFTDAPVEVDAYIPLVEEPTTPATEIPVIVDGVEETPVTPEVPVEAPVEVDPIIPIEEEPVVDPAEEPVTEVPNEAPKHEVPAGEIPVIEEPEAPKHEVPAGEIPVIEEPTVPSVPVTEEPVVPTTPATEAPVAPVAPAAVRIPFTGAVLPNTGETSSVLAVLGFVVLAAAAFVASRKRA